MARLNETAAPMDAAEILLRKYSRQNKEIARVNSTQCIRIRNLENEVSRLLAENLELREQIIRQQAEADLNDVQQVVNHVRRIKAELEAKLSEMGSVIITLGDAPSPRRKITRENKGPANPARSPNQRNWRNLCTQSEAVGGQDGRLPSIMEDKAYPRRTLNAHEVVALLSDPVTETTNSPDIGPPPVSQFVNEDPVKIDLPNKVLQSEDISSIDPANSINLEQRRKRKDTTGTLEHKRPSRFEPRQSVAATETAQSLKSGAKRKLSSRDDEDTSSNTQGTDVSPDDFKFARRTVENKNSSQVSEKSSTKVHREIAVPRGVTRDKSDVTVSATRKALGPKTTNTDVANSPKKNTKIEPAYDFIAAKNDALKKETARDHQRDKKQPPAAVRPVMEPLTVSIDIQQEPETPAGTDIFSPLSSGSTGAREESRDTPPPPDLGPGNEGQRPSRRARGAVSYAEPNLRDKMRRPTKELVDAVTAESKAQRNSFIKVDQEPSSTSTSIKLEPEDDGVWKSKIPSPKPSIYSNSPLGDKATSRDAIAEVLVTQQRRRGSMHSGSDSELSRPSSTSAISAMLAERRKIKQEEKKRTEQVSEPLEQAMAKLDIYEFTSSSPAEVVGGDKMGSEDKYVARISRRASSVKSDMILPSAAEIHDGGTSQTSTSWISTKRRQSVTATETSDSDRGQKLISSTSSRRRQSSLGLGQTGSQSDIGRHKLSEVALERSNTRAGIVGMSDSDSRSDRVNSRRRSMML